MSDITTTQLRSLAGDFQNKADFLNIAADLQDTGYKTDQARIDADSVAVRNAVAEQVTSLEGQVTTLTDDISSLQVDKETLMTEKESLTTKQNILNAYIVSLKNQLVEAGLTPVELED
jgi:predicted  nucleic acid-binding Zn-ribbon protein